MLVPRIRVWSQYLQFSSPNIQGVLTHWLEILPCPETTGPRLTRVSTKKPKSDSPFPNLCTYISASALCLSFGHTARDQVHIQIPLSNVEEFELHLNLVIPRPGDPRDPHGSAGESTCTVATPSSEDGLAWSPKADIHNTLRPASTIPRYILERKVSHMSENVQSSSN